MIGLDDSLGANDDEGVTNVGGLPPAVVVVDHSSHRLGDYCACVDWRHSNHLHFQSSECGLGGL
jgi:hypothetical protein